MRQQQQIPQFGKDAVFYFIQQLGGRATKQQILQFRDELGHTITDEMVGRALGKLVKDYSVIFDNRTGFYSIRYI